MKALIISDIHSNIEALRAIWARERDSDVIYCAGDLVDYGTHPVEAVEWLAAHGAHCVMGNHDAHLLEVWQSGEHMGLPPAQSKWVHLNCQALQPAHIAFLKSLPQSLSFTMDGIGYLLKHRHQANYTTIDTHYHFEQHWAEHAESLRACEERRMIFGHTHRQGIHILGEGALWLNPGSASYRRRDDPTKDAYYSVIEDGQIRLRHVPYDHTPSLAATRQFISQLTPEEWHTAYFFFGGRDGEPVDAVRARSNEEYAAIQGDK